MTPPTVNAYYNPTMNEIVFPAGILQPPFFDMTADDAVNYGAIGAVIGHEITHGFDDQGSRSDAQGNLVNWWADDDRARFTAKTDRLVAQYDACTVLDDLHVNGKLTLGENIADLGGVTISYAAYQKSLAGHEPPDDRRLHRRRSASSSASPKSGVNRSATPICDYEFAPTPIRRIEFRALVPALERRRVLRSVRHQAGRPKYRDPTDRVEVW